MNSSVIRKIAGCTGILGVYIVLQYFLTPLFGGHLATLCVFPSLIIGWWCGLTYGFIAGLLIFPIHLTIYFSMLPSFFPLWATFQQVFFALLETFVATATGTSVGYLRDILGRVQTELLEKNRATDMLIKSYHTLEKSRNIIQNSKKHLENQKEMLQKINSELNNFVYTISHDLKSPISSLLAFGTLLEQKYQDKLDDKGLFYVARIKQVALRMKDLIEDLLTLSRISRIKNPFEEVNMNHLLEDVVQRLDFQIGEYKTAITIAPNLPTLFCDRIKVAELFYNLFSNAIKFSSKKPNPTVEFSFKQDAGQYIFSVKDNGIGIEPKYQKDIFKIFTRLNSSSEYEGTGMGLSIVKRVLDDHGGKIWIDSQLGDYTIVHVAFPVSSLLQPSV